MDKSDFYKEHYFFEINRKQALTSALTIPIGILTVFGGVVGFFIKNFQFNNINFYKFIFLIFLLINMLYIAKTIYYLIRSYHNYLYKYIPTTYELKEYYQRLEEYYETQGKKQEADREFEEFLNDEYTKATQENTWNNDSKSEFLHKANTSLIYVLIFTILCSFPFFIEYNLRKDKVYKVKVIDSVISLEHKEQAMPEEQPTTQTKPPQNENPKPVQKPEPPKGREIREGEQPPKPTIPSK